MKTYIQLLLACVLMVSGLYGQNTVVFSSTTPAAPTGSYNISWQRQAGGIISGYYTIPAPGLSLRGGVMAITCSAFQAIGAVNFDGTTSCVSLFNPASPGPIGITTPNTGNFTTVKAGTSSFTYLSDYGIKFPDGSTQATMANYPTAIGVANWTGSAWGTSLTAPSGAIVGTTDTQTLTNKTVDGVTPTVFGYLDPTSSVQTQLNAKASAPANALVTTTCPGSSLTMNTLTVVQASSACTITLPSGSTGSWASITAGKGYSAVTVNPPSGTMLLNGVSVSSVTIQAEDNAGFFWAGSQYIVSAHTMNPAFTTVAAVATVSGSAFTAIPPGANCIFEGDSITAGFGLSAGQDWPSQAMLLPQFANCTKYNFAVAGSQVADLQARYVASVQPLKPATTGKPAFLFVWVGTNNLGTGAMSAASTLTALQTYWSGAIADGFTVVAATITPRGTSAGGFALSGTQETQRYILNSSIRGLVGSAFSYLMDFDRALQDSTDTNLYQDGLHPAATGARILAQNAAATIAGRSGIQAIANPANPVPTTPTYANAVNLTSGSDLNTVVGCGVYDINGVVNGPPGFSSTPDSGNSWMHLQVLCQSTAANGGSGYAAQFASNLIGTAQTVWYRTEAGGVWNPWVSLIPSSSFLAASTDLNTVTTCGTYDGQNLTNGPLGSNWIHLLVLCNDSSLSNYTSQIATNLIGTTQTMWMRTQNGGASTWNGWIQVYPGTSGILSATSPSIGGSALSVGCTNQSTVTVSGAVTSMACVMSGVSVNPTNIQPQCVVTSDNTVTPQLCTAVATTPGAQTYNVRVIP